ncbi:hypothetical protein DDK22_27445 [Cupriavidus necator]|uniref:Uncharacterized protein n=1 Tax=Cupriavidus necator TaxID=106590 RepID=A0A367PDG9_CUPNE|nr:hypothetical protein DDK22_27445 [Cupriavidus necator]
MSGLVLSGVRSIVLSGVRLSCYQEYRMPAKPILVRACGSVNLSNLKRLTNSSARRRWTTFDRHDEHHIAKAAKAGVSVREAR